MAKVKATSINPEKAVLAASIVACIDNGERILDDAMQVEFQEPACTKLMLSMVAQEEFAKAFVLLLVREDVVPWSPQLLRAMSDHACKQLVGVIIEYVDPEAIVVYSCPCFAARWDPSGPAPSFEVGIDAD